MNSLMKKIFSEEKLKTAKKTKEGIIYFGKPVEFIHDGKNLHRKKQPKRITVRENYFDRTFFTQHVNRKFDVMLDFGCGSGWGIEVFKSFAKNIVGLEISLGALRDYMNRPNAKETKPLLVNNKGKLPFKDNSIDLIIFMRTFEHLPNATFYLKEFHRVLKKDGIIYAVNDAWFYNILAYLTFGTIAEHDPSHINMKTPNRMQKEFHELGFTTVAKTYLPFARYNIPPIWPLNFIATKGVLIAKK